MLPSPIKVFQYFFHLHIFFVAFTRTHAHKLSSLNFWLQCFFCVTFHLMTWTDFNDSRYFFILSFNPFTIKLREISFYLFSSSMMKKNTRGMVWDKQQITVNFLYIWKLLQWKQMWWGKTHSDICFLFFFAMVSNLFSFMAIFWIYEMEVVATFFYVANWTFSDSFLIGNFFFEF